MSPYLPKVIGQEDYVYVWTAGVEGLGDGSDKLVTIGANPDRRGYGRVLSSISVGGRHEAHDADFTDDRRYLWAGGLDDGTIFVFDVAADPARPKLLRTIRSFTRESGGVVGPNGFYALPGRMLISGLSSETAPERTGLVQYSNAGRFIETVWFPAEAHYGYDARALPRRNLLLTSSFTSRSMYMGTPARVFDESSPLGGTMVLWDLHTRKPRQLLDVAGGPLSIRWALQPIHDYAFTVTLAGSKLWLLRREASGRFSAESVATIGDGTKSSLPVDLSLSLDDRTLFVTGFADGTCRVFDVADAAHPHLVATEKIGTQLGRVSQTWYGGRVYFSSAFLGRWERPASDRFVKAYRWDGARLSPLFAVDFDAEKLGRPGAMRFGREQFYRNVVETEAVRTRGEPIVAP